MFLEFFPEFQLNFWPNLLQPLAVTFMNRSLSTRPAPILKYPPIDMSRRRLLAAAPGLSLAVTGGGWLAGCASLTSALPPEVMDKVPPFSGVSEGGPLPAGWKPYIVRPNLAKTVYDMVRRDGRNVLHAVADNARSGLVCAVDIDPGHSPWLRWQWRVDAVHTNATVEDDDAEDAPARIVVAFDGDCSKLPLRDRIFFEQVETFTGNVLPYATLTYVWDGQLPVGRVLPYARSGRIRYQVVESGKHRAGQWLGYERNVLDDFQRVFGEPAPGHIIGIGVMTDSDDLKNHVEAWYADIGLHTQPLGAL